MTSLASSRRAFLRGAGLGAFALPYLRTASGWAAPAPKRLIIFATMNGTVMSEFFPVNGVLGRIAKPLAPLRKKVNFMRGIDMASANKPPVPKDHLPDNNNMLTGWQPIDDNGNVYTANISIDQHIANKIGAQTKYASLQLGVKADGFFISSRGRGQAIAPDSSPTGAFKRLFSGVATDPNAIDRLRREKQSVMDALTGEISALRCALGAADRPKLDAHLESLRELERSLATNVVTGCQPPNLGTVATDVPSEFRMQLDIAAAAVACDLSRIITIQAGGSANRWAYPWLGIDAQVHGIAHGAEGVTAPEAQRIEWLIQIETWHAQQFMYLLQKLDAIQEDGGTALDHSLVLWTHEQADGSTHSRRDMPYVLAGGAGVVAMGRDLKFAGQPHSGLLMSLANAMDVPTATFGDPDFARGPLTI